MTDIDIERYHELAQQKQEEHRKFLATLKKKAPKNLDKITQEIHTEVFNEIDCTKCANCCKSLGPLFTEEDITRISDVRPKACREFPHTDRKKIYQINKLTIKNTLFCPAAYLFVEKLKERLEGK